MTSSLAFLSLPTPTTDDENDESSSRQKGYSWSAAAHDKFDLPPPPDVADHKKKVAEKRANLEARRENKKKPVKLKRQEEKADNEIRAIPYEDHFIPSKPKKWHPLDHLTREACIAINGARGEGKSYVARCLLWHMRHWFREGWCITNTAENGYWQPIFGEDRVIDGEYLTGSLEWIMEYQKPIAAQYHADPESINPFVVLVLEDVGTDLRDNKELQKMIAYGRHKCICVMLLTQRIHMLDTKVRDNIDIFIALRTRSASSKKAIWESYMSDVSQQEGVVAQATWCWKDTKTEKAQCMIILNRKGGNTIQDRLRAYIACDPGPFIIGSPSEWGFDSDEDEGDDDGFEEEDE